MFSQDILHNLFSMLIDLVQRSTNRCQISACFFIWNRYCSIRKCEKYHRRTLVPSRLNKLTV